ncbi:MAG: (d)CMP kinase [Gemmatimonadales bacterium]|nr:(d)CMP kinase [Gemmatimonadales bacterium]
MSTLTMLDKDLDPGVLPSDAVIAVDGPAGSGKSTTARYLADCYGLVYIDTGAMYRALTWAALQAGVDTGDEAVLLELLTRSNLEFKSGRGEAVVLWNGKDISPALRGPEVDASVSSVSSHPAIRQDMVRRQQAMGRSGGVVMEGRDIGSVVFPLATAKIYLDASLEARARRRHKQNQQRGVESNVETLVGDLAERDRLDSSRTVSPLTISPDAIVIDSSNMTLEQQNLACARACLVNPTLDLELDTDFDRGRMELPAKYRFAYAIFKALARFYGLREIGCKGRSLARGCIAVANHISYWDPPLVGSTFHRYRVNSIAKEELFKHWPAGHIFRYYDSIPIRRKGYDKAAFEQASKSLSEGNTLLFFPEGTRRAIGHPGPVRNGIGIVVQATLAPVQPIFIRGSYGLQPGGSLLSPLEVSYGPVIRWHALETLLAENDPKNVSRRIANLCEAAFYEMQARSFARHPQTPFERETGQRQLKSFAKRQKRVFGR